MAKKQSLSCQDIEASLEVFKNTEVPAQEVGYTILKAFGKSDADIRRYRDGKGLLSSFDGLLIKGLLGFKAVSSIEMTASLEALKSDPQLEESCT